MKGAGRKKLRISHGPKDDQLIPESMKLTRGHFCLKCLKEMKNASFFCTVVKCKNLTALAFGEVEGSSMEYGSTLNFTCNTGYTLRGSRGRTCQANGMWSGEEALCDSKYFC